MCFEVVQLDEMMCSGQFYSEETATCQEFVTCTEIDQQLNEATNTCEKKAQKKRKYGLIMLMLMIIAGGTIYAILDDKYFMEPNRSQLATQE